MHEIDERGHSGASPARVFDLLADGRSWAEWGGVDSVEVSGGPGVGEERILKTGRVRNHERVVEFEPPHTFGYVSLSGLPIRDYRATVTLTDAADGGTDIRWHSQFQGRYGIGWLVQRRLGAFIGKTVEALAREAERGA